VSVLLPAEIVSVLSVRVTMLEIDDDAVAEAVT
jgi:hypothetical protein